jgi:hypothetical protein
LAAVAFETVPEATNVGEKIGSPDARGKARLWALWPLESTALPVAVGALRIAPVSAERVVVFCANRKGAPNTLRPSTGSAKIWHRRGVI